MAGNKSFLLPHVKYVTFTVLVKQLHLRNILSLLDRFLTIQVNATSATNRKQQFLLNNLRLNERTLLKYCLYIVYMQPFKTWFDGVSPFLVQCESPTSLIPIH